MKMNKLFSIEDYGETHKILRLFGITFKFMKREYAKLKKQSPYYYYKKNNIDITTLPPATGQARDIQLANLVLLKELDYVCKQNGLRYWIDFGTLLGAIRHKGFVPWDDDIDTGMLREDYAKIIDAFQRSSRNPDIFAGLTQDQNNNCIIKVQHKKCPCLFVDIFPWDSYGDCLITDEQINKSTDIKEIRKPYKHINIDKEELLKQLEQIKKDKILSDKISEHGDYVWGIDYGHNWKNWFMEYDLLNPLKTISFEGIDVSCPNKPEKILAKVYGDYMAYPKKITMGHSMFLKLSDEDKAVIEELKRQF